MQSLWNNSNIYTNIYTPLYMHKRCKLTLKLYTTILNYYKLLLFDFTIAIISETFFSYSIIN